MRATFYAGTAIILMLQALAVTAQAAPAAGTAQPAAAGTDNGLEVVVVTAQRRREDLQKSSLAIQVLKDDDLKTAGASDAKSLTLLVPGLQVGMAGASTQIYIRGVGDYGANSLGNPAVATSLDGVYIARETAIAGMFYDLARVEVLKGPQGTLYGRNASGGAINIITNRPNFDRFGGSLDVEVGNYGEFNTEGALNVPVNEHLALRVAFQTLRHLGYLSDGTDDASQQSGRLEALWEPNERLTLLLEGDYTHQGGHGDGFALRVPGAPLASTPWLGLTDSRSNAAQFVTAAAIGFCIPTSTLNGLDTATPPRGQLPPPPCDTGGAGPGVLAISGLSRATFQNNILWGVHAQLDWDLDWATLTIIPAYRSTRVDYIADPAFESYAHPDTSAETTFEARLSANKKALKWVAGVYYFKEDQLALDTLNAGLLINSMSDESLHSESYAAYGQATVSLTAVFRLIGGLRYTHDTKTLSGSSYNDFPSLSFAPPAPGVPAACLGTAPCLSETFAGKVGNDDVSWKAGIEYDLAAENMLYLTASTGYKAGGLNDSAGSLVYKPEKLLAFDAGSRNRFLDNRLQVNLEAFYWKYRDQQIPHNALDTLGNVALVWINAGQATMKGADLDIAAKPTVYDTVHIGVEYLDSHYNSFKYAAPSNNQLPPAIPGVTTGCAVTSVIDCSGFQVIAAPRWAGTVSWEHVFPLSNDGAVSTHVDASFASRRWTALDFLAPQERAPSYVVETASITYTVPSGKWQLMAFVRNITNRPVYTIASESPFVPSIVGATIGEPRTYGVNLSARF